MWIKSVLAFALAFSALAQAAEISAQGQTSSKKRKVMLVEEEEVGASDLGKNGLSVELLGRGLLYGLYYDRLLTEQIALGIGFSNFSASSETSKSTATIIPIYGNFYFTKGSHRPFITGGADIVTVTWNHTNTSSSTFIRGEDPWGRPYTDNKGSASGTIPVLGGGYEFRGQGGFLFRGTLYQMFAGAKNVTWFGLSFGAAI